MKKDWKYIINNGHLKIDFVSTHQDLAKDHTTTKGGGNCYINPNRMQLYLYGESEQFGKASEKAIIDALTKGYYSTKYIGYRIYFCRESLMELMRNNSILINIKDWKKETNKKFIR